MSVKRSFLAKARAALVGAVTAGFLLALALATSPQLHELVHHDGGQPAHSCLATTLHAGAYEDVSPGVVSVQPLVMPAETAPLRVAEHAESFFLHCRLLRHGPPRLLLS